jgi:hypothetical protein
MTNEENCFGQNFKNNFRKLKDFEIANHRLWINSS